MFDRTVIAGTPNPETHVPVKVHIPVKEDASSIAAGRPDLPPPSLWERSVKVVRKLDGKEAIVNSVDLRTMMFRAWYPDEGPVVADEKTGQPVRAGRFADRTEWESCKDWNPSVVFSPKELERQAAQQLLDEEVAKLDQRELAAVSVLVDGDDPAKGLAKLEALRMLGIIKSVAVSQEALTPPVLPPEPKKGGR